MKSTRRLALRRETLTDLTSAELAGAGGAAGAPPTQQAGCDTQDVNAFLNELYWRYSIHQHCTWTCI